MKNNISLLIFDLDGTLLDTAKDLCNAINFARNSFGLKPLPLKTVASYVGDGIKKLVERSFRDADIDRTAAGKIASEYYKTHMFDETRLYEGVAGTLPRLPFKKALVTNKPAEFVPGLLAHYGIERYFDLIVGGDTLPYLKPDPRIVDYISKTLGIEKNGIVMVGDHRTDLEMARQSGIRSVFCEYGIGEDGDVSSTWKISKFGELIRLLQ